MTEEVKSKIQFFFLPNLKLNDDYFKGTRLFPSIRFLIAILLFFGYATQYTQKTNMSVAIVCMINNTALLAQTNSTYNNSTSANVTDPCLFKLSHAATVS
jgi:hypothetical protein